MSEVRWRNDALGEFLGLRWDAQDTVRLSVRPELLNQGGLLSGAVTYAMVDYGMGAALWPSTSAEESIATMNIAINYLATARKGDVLCRSVVDRRTRWAASLRSEVCAEDGRLLCTAVGSYAIFARRG